jgi:hypothetical protein
MLGPAAKALRKRLNAQIAEEAIRLWRDGRGEVFDDLIADIWNVTFRGSGFFQVATTPASSISCPFRSELCTLFAEGDWPITWEAGAGWDTKSALASLVLAGGGSLGFDFFEPKMSVQNVVDVLRSDSQQKIWEYFQEADSIQNSIFSDVPSSVRLLIESVSQTHRFNLANCNLSISARDLSDLWDGAVAGHDDFRWSFSEIAAIFHDTVLSAIFSQAYLRVGFVQASSTRVPATHEWVLSFLICTGISPPRLSEELEIASTPMSEIFNVGIRRRQDRRRLSRAFRSRGAPESRTKGNEAARYLGCRYKARRGPICRAWSHRESARVEAPALLHSCARKMVDQLQVEGERRIGCQA